MAKQFISVLFQRSLAVLFILCKSYGSIVYTKKGNILVLGKRCFGGGMGKVCRGFDQQVASRQSCLQRRLLRVREMLSFSYILVCSSAPSGTLTMLRLASPIFSLGWGLRGFVGRMTGGMCVLQVRLQQSTLVLFTSKSYFISILQYKVRVRLKRMQPIVHLFISYALT